MWVPVDRQRQSSSSILYSENISHRNDLYSVTCAEFTATNARTCDARSHRYLSYRSTRVPEGLSLRRRHCSPRVHATCVTSDAVAPAHRASPGRRAKSKSRPPTGRNTRRQSSRRPSDISHAPRRTLLHSSTTPGCIQDALGAGSGWAAPRLRTHAGCGEHV